MRTLDRRFKKHKNHKCKTYKKKYNMRKSCKALLKKNNNRSRR